MEVVMRKVIGTSVLALGVFFAAGSGVASASSDIMRVNIPFAFTVKGQTYKAGAYRLERDEQNSGIVRIVGDRGNHEAVIVATIPAAGHDPAGDKPAVAFLRDGSQYELKSIWDSASDGREVIVR
jgi:hypothetical protein